jgi:hypothetical protein
VLEDDVTINVCLDPVDFRMGITGLSVLLGTAKASGCAPYVYLRRVFTDQPKATTLAEIEALMPWNVTRPATQSVAA